MYRWALVLIQKIKICFVFWLYMSAAIHKVRMCVVSRHSCSLDATIRPYISELHCIWQPTLIRAGVISCVELSITSCIYVMTFDYINCCDVRQLSYAYLITQLVCTSSVTAPVTKVMLVCQVQVCSAFSTNPLLWFVRLLGWKKIAETSSTLKKKKKFFFFKFSDFFRFFFLDSLDQWESLKLLISQSWRNHGKYQPAKPIPRVILPVSEAFSMKLR